MFIPKFLNLHLFLLIFLCIIPFSLLDNINSELFDFSLIEGHHVSSEEEMNSIISQSDMTFFVLYYKSESQTSSFLGKMLLSIKPKLEYISELILFNCDSPLALETPQCKNPNDNLSQFVFLEVYEPPVYKFNPYTKQPNKHSRKPFTKNQVSENVLFNYITSNIISRGQKVTNENYKLFISNGDMNKVLLFTDKTKTPLLFRGISNYYYDQLLFGEVSKNEKELCEKLGIEKFPTLMVYQTHEDGVIIDESRTEIYKGENTIGDIVKYLEQFALKEKKYKSKEKSGDVGEGNNYFRKVNTNNLLEYIEKNNKKNIVIYFDNVEITDDSSNKIDYSRFSKDVKEFNSQSHGFFSFAYVNCNGKENSVFCGSNFKINEYPSMILYKAKDNYDKYYETVTERIDKGAVQLSFEYRDIQKEINSLFEGIYREGNPQNLNSLLTETAMENKIAIIYLFDSSYVQMGLSLITLDEKYKKVIKWIVYDNPPQDFLKNMNLDNSKLPTLAIALPEKSNSGQMRMIVYNDQITYSKIKAFLEQTFQLGDSDNENNSFNKNQDEIKKENEITFIKTTEDLVQTCSKKKLCMIGFFDQRTNDESVKLFNEKFEIFKNVSISALKRPIAFGYVNATCQSEFASKFNVDSSNLPNVVIYSYNKDVYANFIGIFKQEDIEEFITKVVSGRVNFQKIQKENAILNKELKCEEIQDIVIDEDDDEFMKELLEEQRKQREMFDKERGMENDKTKKKKKKKKKGKKKREDL